MNKPCRCCGEPTRDISRRWDASPGVSLGFVCHKCYADLDPHLLLTAAAIIDGAIQPQPQIHGDD